MKKLTTLVLLVLGLGLGAVSGAFAAEKHADLQAIKKAVADNPTYVPGKEVRCFNVLVSDEKSGKVQVSVSLPIVVVEVALRCVGTQDVILRDKGCRVDVQALFAELKKLGPQFLIEVIDHGTRVKIWFE